MDTGCLLHTPGCFSGWSAAGDLCSGVSFLVKIQKCLLNRGFAGTGAAGDHTQLACKTHFDRFTLLRCQSETQLSLFVVNGLVQIRVFCNGSMHLPDDLISKAFLDPESLGFENTVAVRYQLPVLNESDSSGSGHIFCHTDRIKELEAGF